MENLLHTRPGWFLRGLPSLARAQAMYHARRYTMTTPQRCKALWEQCHEVMRHRVPGCFAECGVWRGGSSAIMGLAARHAREPRHLHLFDSFEGLPEPTATDGQSAAEYSGGRASGALKSVGQCQVGLAEVKRYLLDQLRFDESLVHFHVGWFQNTIPAIAPQLGPIALLRLDGDWYESTMVCLDGLYQHVSPGGIIVLDDYHAWAGCRKATDEFRARHHIQSPLHKIDFEAVYWVKGA
ncbi:MAG: TylF/MycF/NovP-related O-methyltransferase [Verrucomicrobiota bacterium]